MNRTKHRRTRITTHLIYLSICLVAVPSVRADVLESARMLPDDTVFMVSVESVSALRAALEKTSLYGLYQDPAIQKIVAQAEEKIREHLDEAMKEFWQEVEIENPPKEIPWPQGRVVLGLSIALARAEAGGSPDVAADGPLVRVVLLAEMGSRIEQARKIMRSLSDSAKDAGDTVKRRDIGGIQLDVIEPIKGSDGPTIAYGVKGNWLLVSLDFSHRMDYIESVAKRLNRSLPGSLGDNAGFRKATRSLGEAEAFAYVNADAVRALVAGLAPDKVKVERMTKALGLENVTGLATAIQIAGHRSQDLCMKTLIGVEGPKHGIPALMSPTSAPLRLNDRLVTRDAVGFLCANYEPPRLFDGIAKIAMELAFVDINVIVQAGMMARTQEGGQPPVQLRDDVLAQIAAPLFVTWKMDKPYTALTGIRFLMGLSIRDGDRLDAALARMHRAFAGPDPTLQRELLNRMLYLFPADESPDEPEGGDADVASSASNQLAFSVTGDNLVFGPVGEVEQAIRGRQTESDHGIVSDPMFRYARKHLPAQAGLYYYRNNRLDAEIAWTVLKQMVRDMAQTNPDQTEQDGAFPDPVAMFLSEISEYIDLNRLPEFRAVEKYWGATIGFVQDHPEGIYLETTALKPASP